MIIRIAPLALAALLTAAGTACAQAGNATSSADSALIAQERSIFDAIARNDWDAMNGALGGDFLYVDANGITAWQLSRTAEMMKGCTTGPVTMDDARVTQAGTDVAVLTYKATADQSCNGRKAPSPVYVLSVWKKQGNRWVAVAHSETPAAPAQ